MRMLFPSGGIAKMKRMMLSRRLLKRAFALLLPVLVALAFENSHADVADDYARLVELIQLDDQQQPLCVFNDFEEEFDKTVYRATRQYFKENPGLIQRIKNKLKGGKLRWKIRGLKHRLLFVPENRSEYATLYEDYCQAVIHEILDKTGFPDPYDGIQTLQRGAPLRHEGNEGITVYIVHNLAREYVGTYVFSNHTDKKVKIELKGKLYSGDVGAYSSTLIIDESGKMEFVKDNFTIWQNSAANPHTALMVPAEETLHITLRRYTESAIKKAIKQRQRISLKSVEKIVEDWMAVEEAIVGGVVHQLLPDILAENAKSLSMSFIEMDIFTKSQFDKYRHLEKGIDIVEEIGYQEAIRLYSKDPAAFRDLLLQPG